MKLKIDKKDCLEFSETLYCDQFREQHYPSLKQFLENFLKCEVNVVFSPVTYFNENYNIDPSDNPEKLIHFVNDERLLVFVHAVEMRGKCICFGLDIHTPELGLPAEPMAWSIARMLEMRFQKGIRLNFDVDLQDFGQNLVLDIIVNYLSRGGFDRYHLRLLFQLFISVLNLTFEDRPFNTGLILTHSNSGYTTVDREGSLVALKDPVRVQPTKQFQKRFWYLADGSSCFFVCDRKLKINNMFFLQPQMGAISAISTFFLNKALHGLDVAFRTIQGKEMVAVAASGEEFTYTGTQWHFRDYKMIRNAMSTLLPSFSEQTTDMLLELVFSQMSNRKGSLLWIPEREEDIEKYTIRTSQLWQNDISIQPQYSGFIQRLASSDGALVICPDGKIKAFAAVANLSGAISSDAPLIGSGGLAALHLSHSGIAIKISQDGTARVYVAGKKRWMI
ncbi:MAG: hypothetical protein HQL69_10965 [Magnetococcales bacterium]|nr:hypothetical protein [Magnetococcales bacterium]